MKALVLEEKDVWPVYRDMPEPKKYEGQVVVDLHTAALNHRDVWQVKGLYPGFMVPAILGSDGCGTLNGRKVIINPSLNWGSDERFAGSTYLILGMHMGGTFAEHLAIDERQVHDKPAHMSDEEAASLPLAGLTAYRALFKRSALRVGERVLISGIGGGVASIAFQFAIAAGCEVYVTSSSEAKIERAVSLGARGGIDYNERGWGKSFYKQTGGADVIIDSAGGPGFGELVEAVARGGRISIYGGTRGNLSNIKAPTLFFKQASILGSTMGSDQDFQEMLSFVNEHEIRPIVDRVFSLSEGAKALQHMDKGEQFGKIVLKIR
jgi:NADPH:quinone reductase-like Zn-dependent oxidoreductase